MLLYLIHLLTSEVHVSETQEHNAQMLPSVYLKIYKPVICDIPHIIFSGAKIDLEHGTLLIFKNPNLSGARILSMRCPNDISNQ